MHQLSSLRRALACLLLVAAGALSFGQDALAQKASARAALEGLRFLEGHWTGTFRGDRPYETYWSGPSGGAYMGMIRFFGADTTRVFELLTIEPTERGVVLSVKHFHPGLIGWEEKDVAVQYRLVEQGPKRAVFEHEGDGTRLLMDGSKPDVHYVQRGTLKDGEWVWTDLFVGKRGR